MKAEQISIKKQRISNEYEITMNNNKNNFKWSSPSETPPGRPVKHEPTRIPSPTFSCLTTATTVIRPGRSTSPTPSCSSERGQITIRPLSSIIESDDQMSVISTPEKPSPSQLCLQQVKPFQITQEEETDDWRSSIGSVGDRLKYILENDNKYQDVVFEVQGSSREQFRAHKLIVRIASPVFDKLFKESEGSNQTSQQIIPVSNVEPSTFKCLLKFIYTDQIDEAFSNEQDVLSLLKAAKNYGVQQLYLECVNLLKHQMSNKVAIQLCTLAASYGDTLLLDAALDHIANNAFQIFLTEDFLQLDEENMFRLFLRDDLRIDEVGLFDAAIKWGEFRCTQQGISTDSANMRNVLQKLIPEIRFPLMRADEFTLLVTPNNLLTPQEQIGIFQYLSVDPKERHKLPKISFKTTPRRSKKCVEIDSDSSMDYREESSVSPEYQERLQSISNQDGQDLTTTEAESETASNVSAYSTNSKRLRKLERSESQSSSNLSKKRRRISTEPRTSVDSKPIKSVPIEDLFGDFDENHIKLEDVTISLNKWTHDWSKHENRDKVESIEFKSVKIGDSKSLDGRKIHFPRLKSFYLNIQIEESISSIISDKEFSVEKYLFFCGKHSRPLLYADLWSMNIDITLIVNKVIVFRIAHGELNHVVLNKFNGAPTVLKSLSKVNTKQSVKSLVYSHTHFKDNYFPLSISRMVLLGVVGSQCISGFVKQFKHLKELTLMATADYKPRALNLEADFLSKDKIRKLSVCSFKIHLEPSIRFYNILKLSLWRVTWEVYFEDKFNHIFPKLQEFTLLGPVVASGKMMKNIFKISSLKEVISWNVDWHLSSSPENVSGLKSMLTDCGLVETDKSFILKKHPDTNEWTGNKISYTVSQDHIYKKFDYEYLYEDLSAFRNTS